MPALTRPARPSFLPLFLVVTVALVLRVWGITWGLPNATRAFSYHPDESLVVGASLRVDPLVGRFDPQFYNYGSWGLLVNGAVIHTAARVGLLPLETSPAVPSLGALLAARFVTALLGAGTCVFLSAAGTLLYDRRAGLTAAALYAIAPLAVQHGHFATVDVPATFWLTGSLYFAARGLRRVGSCTAAFAWAGVFAGLAAATKYNAGLVLLAGVAGWLLTLRDERASLRWRAPVLLVLGSVFGFLVGCPGAVTNTDQFLRDLRFESQHVQSGHGNVFTGTPSGFIYHLSFNLNCGLGLPLLLVVLVACGYALYRRRPGDLLLLAFSLPYYVLIGLAQVKFARYTIPLLPPLFLFMGAMLPPLAIARDRLLGAAMAAAALFALLYSAGFDKVMAGDDPRDQAAAFIRARGITSVGFVSGPWFYSPPLDPFLASPQPAFARHAADAHTGPVTLFSAPLEWDTVRLRETDPGAVVLSELHDNNAVRLGQPEAKNYLETVRANYAERTVFAAPVQLWGITFTRISERRGLPAQNLPEDMLYTNPTTIVFTKGAK